VVAVGIERFGDGIGGEEVGEWAFFLGGARGHGAWLLGVVSGYVELWGGNYLEV